MIIIMTISSITFAFRAVLEILFFFDITLLDFEYVIYMMMIIMMMMK